MFGWFVRLNKEEEYSSDGTNVLFYPEGKDEPIKFTGKQVMRMFDEAYLSGIISKPNRKHMSDLHFFKVIRRYG